MEGVRGQTHIFPIYMHSIDACVEGMAGRFNTYKEDMEGHGKNSCEGISLQVMDSEDIVKEIQSLIISSIFPSMVIMCT